jgi:hypothetical protein
MGATLNFNNETHIVGLSSPADSAGVAVTSDIVNVGKYHSVSLLVYLGTLTGDTAVVTVEECDDVTPTNNTAIAFRYRESGATTTSDAYGAVTAATSSGFTFAATDDDHILMIDINGADLTDGYPYVRVVVTPGGSASASELAILAVLRPRYPQSDQTTAIT